MSEPLIFFAAFPDGYSFRNLIATLRQEFAEANFILSEKTITLAQTNQSNYALYVVNILSSELKAYQYNVLDDEGKKVQEIAVGFKTADMMKATKLIKKRDGVYLYMKTNDNTTIYVQPVSSNTKDGSQSNIGFVPCIDVEHFDHQPPDYQRSVDDPNTKVLASDFSTMCTSMSGIKCSQVAATGYPNGIIFKGILPGKSIGRVTRFGVCNSSNNNSIASNLDEFLESLNLDETRHSSSSSSKKLVVKSQEDLCTVHIPISTIKSLSKINNLSASGTMVKLYIEEARPLKIVSPLGAYGTFTVYLRDIPEDA